MRLSRGQTSENKMFMDGDQRRNGDYGVARRVAAGERYLGLPCKGRKPGFPCHLPIHKTRLQSLGKCPPEKLRRLYIPGPVERQKTTAAPASRSGNEVTDALQALAQWLQGEFSVLLVDDALSGGQVKGRLPGFGVQASVHKEVVAILPADFFPGDGI